MKKQAGWTLPEVLVSSGLLFLLVAWGASALVYVLRTLRVVEHEGERVGQVAHSAENLQRRLLGCRPLKPGSYLLGAEPLQLVALDGRIVKLSFTEGMGRWQGISLSPARSVRLVASVVNGHVFTEIHWEAAGVGEITNRFDATVLP